jgi:ATP/ADP translocase
MHPSTLLRTGAVTFILIGGAITVWLLDKAIRYPDIQASQFENTAPLWTPTILFVVVCTAAGSYILFRAAQRVDQGDDLFAQRHRRRPDAPEEKQDTPS